MAESSSPSWPRRMWEAVERYHGLCYSAPEPRQTATAAGLKGFWMNYFATRAAPLGPVGPEVVEATFFYYAPVRVRRAIPDAWSFSTPERILAARYQGMDVALRRVLGEEVGAARVAEAADLARRAATHGHAMCRSLYAGWSSLAWPDEPHLTLWHACTLLREHRSGSHLIALAAQGFDGCQSVVSQVAVDEGPRAWIHDEAGWTDEQAQVAVDALRQRGWLDDDGRATAAGREGRQAVERLTDELDATPWLVLDEAQRERLLELMAPLHRLIPQDDQLDWREIYGQNPGPAETGGVEQDTAEEHTAE